MEASDRKRILFIMNQYGVCRFYLPTLKVLAERGHELHLHFTHKKVYKDGTIEGQSLLEEVKSLPNVQVSETVLPKYQGEFARLNQKVRDLRDLIRYSHPDYAQAHKLRARLERIVKDPQMVRGVKGLRRVGGYRLLKRVDRLLAQLDRALPICPQMKVFLRGVDPDLVLFSRLVDPKCPQKDYLKAARVLGMRTGVCVASWDNLTNKGLMQNEPDRVFVWNEFQRRECERYHGVSTDKVVVTGAQVFDSWFGTKPKYSLAETCERLGLKTAAPYVLYTCSSSFIAEKEAPFVSRWVADIRNRLPAELQNLNVVVRPHPQNAKQWAKSDLAGEQEGLTVVSPRSGQYVGTEDAREFYFSLLYHCRGVVGINTSAMVEAGIFDKPVFTILDPLFEQTQRGTLHFSYLVEQGLAVQARDLNQHITQLGARLAGESEAEKLARQTFVRHFLRPKGLDQPAAGILADEIEKATTLAPQAYPAKAISGWVPKAKDLLTQLPLGVRQLVRRGTAS